MIGLVRGIPAEEMIGASLMIHWEIEHRRCAKAFRNVKFNHACARLDPSLGGNIS